MWRVHQIDLNQGHGDDTEASIVLTGDASITMLKQLDSSILNVPQRKFSRLGTLAQGGEGYHLLDFLQLGLECALGAIISSCARVNATVLRYNQTCMHIPVHAHNLTLMQSDIYTCI